MSALPHTYPELSPPVRAAFAASVAAERNRQDRFAAASRAAREAHYAAAKKATLSLTDDQRLSLAAYLIDQVDCDAPDLKTEAESLISDLRGAVEERFQ